MILWLLLTGCGPATVAFPPDLWVWEDTGWGNAGAPVVDVNALQRSCASDQLTIDLSTTVWADQGIVHLFESGTDYTEVHPLETVILDEEWEAYRVGPLTMAQTYRSGESSTLTCPENPDDITVVVEIYDAWQARVDCVSWGAFHPGAADLIHGFLGGCRSAAP